MAHETPSIYFIERIKVRIVIIFVTKLFYGVRIFPIYRNNK